MASNQDIELGVPKSSNRVAPDVPPAYDASPPPSYTSLFGQLKNAKEESDDNVSFGKKFCSLILGSIGCTISLGLTISIPVAMIVIGTLYLNNCTIQRFVPIYLVVFGSFGAFKTLISSAERLRNHCKKDKDEDEKEKNAKPNPVDGLISVFLFAWFIAGNVWVYPIYNTVNMADTTSANYCHPTLYLFAFWVTTAIYIIVGVFLFLGCCCCFAICCCVGNAAGKAKDSDAADDAKPDDAGNAKSDAVEDLE